MAFNLIPFPLSMIFIVIFGFAVEFVLWKLRKNGSAYRWLSNVAIVAGALVTALIMYVVLI